MAPQNPFTARYKNLSNVELLEILEEPEHYQALAIDAARQELDTRQLSQEELESANATLREKKSHLHARQEKKKQLQLQARNTVQKLAENLSPLQQNKPSDEKTIKIICLVYAANFLYEIIFRFTSIIALLSDIFSCGILCGIPAVTILLTPVSLVLLWLKNKNGWILFVFLVSFNLSFLLFNISSLLHDMFFETPGLSVTFYQPPRIETFIWPIVLNGGVLVAITRKSIRAIFRIDRRNALLAILSGVILFVLLNVNLYTLEWN